MTVRMDIRGDVGKLERRLNFAQRKQLPFALMRALTTTARDVREGMKDEIRATFQNPVQMTVDSVLYKGATKQNLTAYVFLRDEASKGTAPVKYLSPQIQGGPRNVKRFERALRAIGLLGANEYAVPAKGYPLDANGNLPRGLITRILSDLRASPDPMQNRAAPGVKRRGGGRKKKATRFFGVWAKRGKLPAGIYERWGTRAIRAVMMFVRAPMYSKRLKYYERANEIARRRFRPNLFESLRQGLRTAR